MNESHDYEGYYCAATESAQSQETPSRTVRIDSSASIIVPPAIYSRIQGDDLESTVHIQDRAAADAEDLFNSHFGRREPLEKPSATPSEDGECYAVSSSTQGGILHQLLQAYNNPEPSQDRTPSKPTVSLPIERLGSSDKATPKRKWYEHDRQTKSQDTLATLVGASVQFANPFEQGAPLRRRAQHRRNSSGKILSMVWKNKEDEDTKIKFHVASIMKRQQYIIKMCRAMMLFGLPTHRLEESLTQSAKVLDINSQFLYIPGCMIISFDDYLTHTAEVKIVRCAQGVNLAKLEDTHDIYKEVLHDVISLDMALNRLDEAINGHDRHPVWLNVIMYGLASTAVSTFFQARLIDMPIIFGLGIMLGFLQLVVSQLSKTYSTVFEITATILISFLARAFGSIGGGNIFCFSALAQSGIAMILPGWVSFQSPDNVNSRNLPTILVGFELRAGASVQSHSARLHPSCLRNSLQPFPWIRNHCWHCSVWSH
jgi:uncharacterized membrane protein YjjP (DUF1212 family)